MAKKIKRQRLRAPQRRRQLLETAAKLFAQKGYHGTTTAQLAKAAGITEPILYQHFSNKLDLFTTLVDEVGREVIAAWKSSLAKVHHPNDRLHVLLAGNPATHNRGRGVYRVVFQAMTDSSHDPSIVKSIRAHLNVLHKFLKKELKSLQKAGVVRDDETASALAWLMIDVAIGYGMIQPLGVPGQSPASRTNTQRLLEEMLVA